MKVICGLGNPGPEYARHRHNVGFKVVEALAGKLGARAPQEKFDALLTQAALGREKLLLVQPQTFMNLSGRSLAAAARFYKVEPTDVLVVHDELDLPFGRLALKAGGGSGGHNGLKSLLEDWSTEAFGRLRFGVGKPEGPNAKERVVSHVLAGFNPEETAALPGLIDRSVTACELWVTQGLAAAMNQINRR